MSRAVESQDCAVCQFRSMMFNSLSKDELGHLTTCKTQYTYSKGEAIVHEGEATGSIIYLHRGLIKLHKTTGDNRSQIMSIAKPYDFVGLLSVFSNETYRYSISAIEDSDVCFINMQCLKSEILSNGKFAFDIIKRISRASDNVVETKFELSRRHLRGRIAYILLDFSEQVYKNSRFELPVSRKEIAELIDMRTENVIRILSEFRKDGIIRINGPEIEIMKPDLLKVLSDSG